MSVSTQSLLIAAQRNREQSEQLQQEIHKQTSDKSLKHEKQKIRQKDAYKAAINVLDQAANIDRNKLKKKNVNDRLLANLKSNMHIRDIQEGGKKVEIVYWVWVI